MNIAENERPDVQLARFAVNTRYFDIPKELVKFQKHLLLKNIANMIAGATMPASRKLTALLKQRRATDDAGVMGYGFRTSLWDAVFLHSFFAHSSELEDDSFTDAEGRATGGSSMSIIVVPVALSVADKLRLSGRDLILALTVGLEVHRRTTLTATKHRGIMSGAGAMGPVMAACKGMGLNVEQTRNAMGLAISSPHCAMVSYGTSSHYFESAVESLQGVMAAELAKEGLTGNPDLVKHSSLLAGEDKVEPQKMVADLGTRWMAGDYWIKKWGCSFGTHRGADIVLELREKHNLAFEDVESVDTLVQLDRPEPRDIEEAQVSIQHVLGAAIRDGDIGPRHFTDEALVDPRYKEARAKVRIVPPPAGEKVGGGLLSGEPDRVVIRMKDGRVFSGDRKYPIGSPAHPLTDDQMVALYRKYTEGVLSSEQIDRTVDLVLNLEKLNDIEELMDILTFRHKVAIS